MMISQKRPIALSFVGLACITYLLVVMPFADYMRSKPIDEKLGYVPSIRLVRPLSVDHKELVGACLVMKVIMYFGGLTENPQANAVKSPPDYVGMSRLLHGALELDPYNMDAYYFAQSFLTWDVKQYKIANDLLEKGMRYRSWDWMLPFFAGFNHAYFMKDFKKAAEYYKRAGELSGSELHMSLAGRYMHESGQTELAIVYLKAMLANARNQQAISTFTTRLGAFEKVREIEMARDRFRAEKRRLPENLDELVSTRMLTSMPQDPYGGRFYLESDGKVMTTSKFAFGGNK